MEGTGFVGKRRLSEFWSCPLEDLEWQNACRWSKPLKRQEVSSSDPNSFWLAAVAAAGTGVSLITLILTVLWRWWDSRSRVTITFVVGQRPDGASPTQDDEGLWINFAALNSSRTPLFPAEAYLQADDGRQLQPMYHTMPGWGAGVLQPGSPATYHYSMARVAEFLSTEGETSASLKFIVRDGAGERHEQGLTIRDIEAWAEGRQGREPLWTSHPWWRRLLGT